MARYARAIPVIAVFLFISCSTQNGKETPDDHGGRAVTVWTQRTELFAEFPALLAGVEADVALHLTLLATAEPVVSGRVLVRAVSATGSIVERSIASASSPGIYRPALLFKEAGVYRLTVIVEAAGSDTLRVDSLRVFRDMAERAAHTPGHEAPRGIAYLKEQQWKTDFRTEVVRPGVLVGTLQSIGEIVPRSGGEVFVSAPFSGYTPAQAGAALPAPGSRVRKGQTLLRLFPSAETQGGSDDFGSRLAAAQSARDLAAREVERAKRLFGTGVISESEFQTKETEFQRAAAAYESLRRVLHSDEPGGYDAGARGFSIKAPIDGYIARVSILPGQPVQTGDPLFHIIDQQTVWLRTYVPMSDYAAFSEPVLVALHVAGAPNPVFFEGRSPRRVSVGKILDQRTRSIPVVFELPNHNNVFTIGATASLQLANSARRVGLSLPAAAVLEDQGQYFVYVQTGGESFERRSVTTGIPQGDRVEIVAGVAEGDRVVTRGASLVRLASSASSVPAHGHAH
ncbi:MAG: efflux RND transporter periplasmic adaptor subunit [Ignavibacteriae bacterium]|nr:efflux RND transporter periplasmic adaptor subunit [Ignavibacteriota bacterium]